MFSGVAHPRPDAERKDGEAIRPGSGSDRAGNRAAHVVLRKESRLRFGRDRQAFEQRLIRTGCRDRNDRIDGSDDRYGRRRVSRGKCITKSDRGICPHRNAVPIAGVRTTEKSCRNRRQHHDAFPGQFSAPEKLRDIGFRIFYPHSFRNAMIDYDARSRKSSALHGPGNSPCRRKRCFGNEDRKAVIIVRFAEQSNMIHRLSSFLIVLITAFVLDTIIGDPETKFHPIRAIGGMIAAGEKLLYRRSIPKRLGGILLTILAITVSVGATMLIIAILGRVAPVLGLAASIVIIAICLAFRSLLDAGTRIRRDLKSSDLAAARRHLSWIVSRDTDRLPETEIVRGTIESLSENLNDAVIAPLFYAVLFGAPGIVGYKTVNTLDSMIGYRSDRYLKFGWFAARLDDVLNYIPARISLLLVTAAAFLLRYDARSAWKTALTYGQTGASPNGGIGICAFAGALNVTLGGTNYFDGEPETTPTVPPAGAAAHPFSLDDITRSERLIVASTLIGLFISIIIIALPAFL